MDDHEKEHNGRPLLIILGILCAALLFAVVFFASRWFLTRSAEGSFLQKSSPLKTDISVEGTGLDMERTEPELEPETVEITVSCVGDCTLGSDVRWGMSGLPDYAAANGYDYFFSNVGDIFAADDLTIINYEGTLTESTARADKNFAFRADPDYVNIVADYSIEACNLANNHTLDYGEQSYTDTVDTLTGAGLLTFGGDTIAYTKMKGISIALIGIDVYDNPDGAQALLEAAMASAKGSGAKLIIVTFHWGVEYAAVPNETQTTLGRLAVDLGANLVVGHHPHILEGIEEYHDANIVYSLGNFCFGGNSNPVDYDTMIYQQTFTFVNGDLSSGIDDNIIPCRISSVSSTNNYCPTPAEGSEAERILEKIQSLSDSIPSPAE